MMWITLVIMRKELVNHRSSTKVHSLFSHVTPVITVFPNSVCRYVLDAYIASIQIVQKEAIIWVFRSVSNINSSDRVIPSNFMHIYY